MTQKTSPEKRTKSALFVTDEVPLYYQLTTLLTEKIASGQYAVGEQLPTESELVEHFGVSRITVRQALSNLEERKLIRREAGRGTFVTDHLSTGDKLEMDGSLDDLISIGLATRVKLLDLSTVSATREDAAKLGVEVGAPLTCVTRLRYYHKKPYSYIVNYLPADIGDRLSREYLERGAILSYIEGELGIALRDADQGVRATLADASLAGHLQTRIGAPLLCVNRVVYAEDGRAIERVNTYYRGDIYSLKLHLTREPKKRKGAKVWELKEGSVET